MKIKQIFKCIALVLPSYAPVLLVQALKKGIKTHGSIYCRSSHTEHGFQFDQAADEVVKVDHLIVRISGYQDLVQFVV